MLEFNGCMKVFYVVLNSNELTIYSHGLGKLQVYGTHIVIQITKEGNHSFHHYSVTTCVFNQVVML